MEESDNKIAGDELDVVLLPLENATDDIIDEDSADEDCPNVNNLPRSQLMVTAVVQSTRFCHRTCSQSVVETNSVAQSIMNSNFSQTCKCKCLSSPLPARVTKLKFACKKEVEQTHEKITI